MERIEELRKKIENLIIQLNKTYRLKKRSGIIWKNVEDYIKFVEKTGGYAAGSISNLRNDDSYKISNDYDILQIRIDRLTELLDFLKEIPNGWNKEEYLKGLKPKLDAKTKKFLNTDWNVYYYKEQGSTKKGIVRGLVKIGENTGLVELFTPNEGKYIGSFELLDGTKILRLSLQTETEERFLNIIGGIKSTASDIQHLIVCGYTNITGRMGIVAGLLILEKKNEEERREPNYYLMGSEESNELHTAIKDFFFSQKPKPHILFEQYAIADLELLQIYLDSH